MKKQILLALLAVGMATAQTDTDINALIANHATCQNVVALFGQPMTVTRSNPDNGIEVWFMRNGHAIVFQNGRATNAPAGDKR